MATRVVVEGRRRASATTTPVKIFSALAAGMVLVGIFRNSSEDSEKDSLSQATSDVVEVLVPSAPIAAGASLKDHSYQKLLVARRSVTKDVVTDEDQILSAVATVNLPAGLPVSSANLSFSRNTANPVSGRIPPGMRAITVKVDATSSVEGWAGSGSIVDVLLIEKNRTTVVAEKVRILSAERSTSPVEGLSVPSVPSTVTLLVTQEQTLSINTAVPLGRIAFALRSTADDSSWKDTTFSADRLSAGQSASTSRPAVTGYVSVGEGEDAKRFALTNGKWLATSSAPDGFFPAEKSR